MRMMDEPCRLFKGLPPQISPKALRLFVGREGRVDLQFLQRYVMRCSERRPRVKETELDIVLGKVEVHQGRHRRLELSFAPVLRDAWVGEHFVAESWQPVVERIPMYLLFNPSQHIAGDFFPVHDEGS